MIKKTPSLLFGQIKRIEMRKDRRIFQINSFLRNNELITTYYTINITHHNHSAFNEYKLIAIFKNKVDQSNVDCYL